MKQLIFQSETILVLMGLANTEEYPSNIENNIGTSKATAEKIAEERS